ncbi:MAG: DUF3108 domain-containing protein [Motiliproteus sp.]|nr:DUF3108 domain-containing protein [Motiliproteus sp.]MCW9053270.1 DUF3108 domain-containing protein [Motiliproteus sp.]
MIAAAQRPLIAIQALLLSILLLGSLLLTSTASAGGNPPSALQPFKAHYTAKFDMGLTVTGSAVRELHFKDNHWSLSQNAEAMVATIKEQSQFQLNQQQLIPQNYSYHRKAFGKKRKALLSFDWKANKVTNNVQDKPWKLGIKPGTLDKLNYQLQLRLDLKQGKTKLNYQVADGGKIKHYQFQVVGDEILDTALGKLPTVKVKRIRTDGKKKQTLIWFAKSKDFLLVKLSQVDKKGKRFDLQIDSLN